MERDCPLSCCFTGSRDIVPEQAMSLFSSVLETVSSLVSKGYIRFYTGGAIGFDTIAALAVLKAKESNPAISLIVVRPCENQDRFWTPEQKRRYQDVLSRADDSVCLSPGYYTGCMQVRNRYMVEHADICIAFGGQKDGGTFHTIRCAQKKGVPVIQLSSDSG